MGTLTAGTVVQTLLDHPPPSQGAGILELGGVGGRYAVSWPT